MNEMLQSFCCFGPKYFADGDGPAADSMKKPPREAKAGRTRRRNVERKIDNDRDDDDDDRDVDDEDSGVEDRKSTVTDSGQTVIKVSHNVHM
jgi:hypothetical protein